MNEGEFKKRIETRIDEFLRSEPGYMTLDEIHEMLEDAKKAIFLALKNGMIEEELKRWFGSEKE